MGNTEDFQYLKTENKCEGSLIKYIHRLEMQLYMKPKRVLSYQDQNIIMLSRNEQTYVQF